MRMHRLYSLITFSWWTIALTSSAIGLAVTTDSAIPKKNEQAGTEAESTKRDLRGTERDGEEDKVPQRPRRPPPSPSRYPRCSSIAAKAFACMDERLGNDGRRECGECMGFDDGSFQTYYGCEKTKRRNCRKLSRCDMCKACRGHFEKTASCFLAQAHQCYGLKCGYTKRQPIY